MNSIGVVKNIMPDMAQAEVGLILVSEWIGNELDLIHAMDLSMDDVESSEWPKGLVSYSCFFSLDRCRVLHYVQWVNQVFHLQYVQNHLAHRLRKMEGKINIKEEKSHGRFTVTISKIVNDRREPKKILIGKSDKTMTTEIKSRLVSEHEHTNLDTGSSMIIFELGGLDDIQLSDLQSESYSLYRSYVQNKGV